MLDLSFDLHVHSTFSDGKNTILENARAAERVGVEWLGCVDHVRRDTDWVGDFLAAVEVAQALTSVQLVPGVEAKMLDTRGNLDMPDLDPREVLILVADHRWPTLDGTWMPRTVRDRLADGTVTPSAVADGLVQGYVAAMHRHGRVVIAHPFSLLPKVGLTERSIPAASLLEFAEVARTTGSIVEVSERWRCPTAETLRFLRSQEVTLCASTDSHRARTIGRYEFVRTVGIQD